MRETTVHLPLSGIRLLDARTRHDVDLGSRVGVEVLTLVRHRYWLPCQEHLVQVQQLLEGIGLAVVTVGFSPPEALAALAEHIGLHGPVLSDERRRTYRLLGFRHAPVWRVYSPGTLLYYARRRLGGHPLPRPVEDTRQMGGDAVVVDGVVVRRFAPGSPDDRVPPARLRDSALELDRGTGG